MSGVPNVATFLAAKTMVEAFDGVETSEFSFSDMKAMEDALEVIDTGTAAVMGVVEAFKVFVPSAPEFSPCTCEACEFGWDNT